MAKVTGLSGNEIYCLALKELSPGELVVGNSVNSMGFLGALGAGVRNILGGEVVEVTQAIQEGRTNSFNRMVAEAQRENATGIAGVTGELRNFSGSTEFLFVGSCVHAKGWQGGFFSSAGSGQELYCHMDAGYQPVSHAFGNIAYSMGIGGGFLGALKTLGKGEIKEYSDVFNHTRHYALDRLVSQARADRTNAVVGVRTTILPWRGLHEMVMTGTAARNPALPKEYDANPVTSDLTGEELWAMASLGYAPIKLLMSTSIYSLGFVGGFLAAFKSFSRGEVNELTRLIHDAREIAIARIKDEADALNAEDVVGVKTYIQEIGNGLVEFMAIGTAIRKLPGIKTQSAALPVHAMVSEKDTWIDGDFGFSLDRQKKASSGGGGD
ncbi:heavy metal-binding domain-containing protein [Aestuariivirga litoralis]|uniref:heavy metal-binding domain-containing protein n=1 Tax=Aestuariivirga litoralis TaxID=2650924 RepID=UPI0018C841C9|nr:heavy metal-binding domain-containing protein [Aestuariivirga litoralis]MBG1231639.1 YbjQ family protein [Aestuariivirga litoralis]